MFLFRPIVLHVGAVAASLAFAPFLRAQCTPDWVPGQAYPGIYGGGAGDAVLWDPDGPGPAPEMLVITGEFDAVGGIVAFNVAAWDGAPWRALGTGFGGRSFQDPFGECSIGFRHSLGVYNDELYAGVSFAGHCPRPFSGMSVLRWDGSDWQAIGGDLGTGSIAALCAFEEDLVVAGYFESIAGVPAHNLALWNGQEWRPLGVSPGDGIDGGAEHLLVHDGRLIVAGSFTSAGGVMARNIASWDGEEWRPLGAGVGGISVLAVYHDEIVAGGDFNAASGDPELIAHWDGALWQPLGAGIGAVDGAWVSSLAVYSDELIVGGYFDQAGGVPAPGAASWNGFEWRAWGAGMESVWLYGVCQGSVLASGSLVTPRGPASITVARWDGALWNFFGDGLTQPVTALVSHNNELIGAMDGYWSVSSCNVRLPAAVSRWDGQCWSPLETRDPADSGAIVTMASYGSDLVVGGRFAMMDGVPAANVARWDGTHWHAVGEGLGDWSVDPIVRALAVYEGRLIAGGTFRHTGGVAAERVASWDGAQWQAMGAGFPNSGPAPPFVAALIVYNGELYAGGRFDLNGVRAGVARWDPAASVWVPIDQLETINDFMLTLAVYGNDLIAGGRVAGESPDFIPFISRWDGSAWQPMGAGLGSDPESPAYSFVRALAVVGPDLIVGGEFSLAGGAGVNNIARWDGTQWHAIGAGVTVGFGNPDSDGGAAVRALAYHAGTLAVGGYFLRAGDHASAYFAQWRCPPCPGDLNGSSDVSLQDLAILLAHFSGPGEPSDGDLDADGDVDLGDLTLLLSNFGTTCP